MEHATIDIDVSPRQHASASKEAILTGAEMRSGRYNFFGSTGSASFNTGTAITLSLTNGRDAIWSGACSSGGNKTKTCTFTLGGAASVTGNVQ
jgi:hypothetical protein